MRRCSALSLKAENDIGSLTVMDSEALNGIITERHYARNVVLKGKSSSTTAMGEIMDRRVITVRPEQSVEECMALMTERRVRHLPVVEGEKNKSSLATHQRQRTRGRKGVGVGVPWPAKLVLFPIAPPDNRAHSRHSRNS
jgi:CBS domain-containing protein